MKSKSREVPRPFAMPWGKGDIVEEITAVGQWHEPAIQLLRYEDGSESVRFCSYDHGGRFQRSPLMLDARLLSQLGRSLASSPRLRAHLARLVAPARPAAARAKTPR
ncbi:MAG: hypothetical protein E6H88_07320 [Chloroflexi bacterium]|nr:MAG: hypothetical protein E6I20_06770 [Chloroflexota bacterium]TMG37082.1 MAG: hypothetical protein E6H88_07320 [Chloroflexota bacterium]